MTTEDYTGWLEVNWEPGWYTSGTMVGYSNTSAGAFGFLGRTVPSSPESVTFDYRMRNTGSGYHSWVVLRDAYPDEDKQLILDVYAGTISLKLRQFSGFIMTTLATANISTTADAWYSMTVAMDGSDVTVSRGEKGGSQSQVLSASDPGFDYVNKFWFGVAGAFEFDNLVLPGAGTSSDVVYNYNAANELSWYWSPNGDHAAIFSYDAWGRVTRKEASPSSSVATYSYGYGGKLRSVTSDFMSESDVTYEYGGDGKRRARTAGGVTIRYKYDAGWNVLAQTNASNTLQMTNVYDAPGARVAPLMADLAGTTPSSGDARYLTCTKI